MRKWLVVLFLAIGFHASAHENDSCPWSEHSYLGPIAVWIDRSSGLKVQIETEDLILQSLSWNEYEHYVVLFGDAANMQKFSRGRPWTAEEVEKCMAGWVKRWEQEHDPLSAFAIFLKAEGYPFVGHIILGHGGYATADLAYVIKPLFQHYGYGKQAVTALLYGYVPQLIQEGYLLNDAWQPLAYIHATARFDNPYSIQILKRVGMHPGRIEKCNGVERIHYTIAIDELLHNQNLRESAACLQ